MFDEIIRESITILSNEYEDIKSWYYKDYEFQTLLKYIHSIKLHDYQIIILTIEQTIQWIYNYSFHADFDIITPFEDDNTESIKCIWDKVENMSFRNTINIFDWHNYKDKRVQNLIRELREDKFENTRFPLAIKYEAL